MSLIARLSLHAQRQPGAPALLGHGETLSYAALQASLDELIPKLRALDLKVLALDIDNGPAWAQIDLAAHAAGITLIPLPPFFSPSQLQHVLTTAGVDSIISDDPQRLRQRLNGMPLQGRERLSLGAVSLSLLATGLPAQALPAGVAKITFTSGTTGEPKGVMLGWRQIESVATALGEAAEAQPGDRHVALTPLSVLLENIAGLYVPLWRGASVSLPSLSETGLLGAAGLDARRMLQTLAEQGATTAIFSPQMLQGAVSALQQGVTMPEGLRFIAVGGAAVSRRLLERAAELGLPVYEGYGLSEFASVVCLNRPGETRPGSVGRPLDHVEIRLAEDGEVLIRGNRFIGYLGEEIEEDAPEWWSSGDLGHLDEAGYLQLHGRRRHVFITSFGRNVSPEWVERELVLEPVLRQAAVFGEARPWNCAVILPAPGADREAVEAALQRVNLLLPDYARVTRWLAADEPFGLINGQLSASGRLRREAILQHYRERLDALYQEELVP